MVQVIAGDHAGKTGEVMRVLVSKNRVLVKGVNLVYKHVRPSRQNPQGGRIRVERPIHLSNVQPLSKAGRGSRVRFVVEKGEKRRVTMDGHAVSVVSRAAKKGKGKKA